MATGLYGTGVYGTDVYGDPAPPVDPGSSVAVTHEVSLRLAITVTHADGRTTRWGGDEPDATRIPNDLTFSTAIPGGFRDMTCSLLRRIDIDYADQGLLDDVTVYGPGTQVAWEGRLQQLPRSHGQSFSITPGAVGWASHLRDDPTFRMVYVDRDTSRWQPPTLDRQIQLNAIPTDLGSLSGSTANHALTWNIPNSLVPDEAIAELWYECPPGVTCTILEYRGTRAGTWTGFETPLLLGQATPTDTVTNINVALTLDGALRTATLASGRRWLGLRAYLNGGPQTPPAGTLQSYTKIGVYGNAINTTVPARINGTEPDGVWASDVIKDAIARSAPLLNTTNVEATSFVIAHLAFHDPTTVENVITHVNNWHLWDWGVYENRGFFYRPSNPDALTWEVRLSDGAHLDLAGDSADAVLNGVVINYTTPDGTRKSVGPPAAYWHNGVALTDDTSSSLVDASAENVATAHGITRKWATFDAPGLCDLAMATTLGSVWLGENTTPKRPGTLRIVGTARHPTEGLVPAWRVRAGDYVRISDHPADLPRRIIQTQYSHGSCELVATLDGTPQLLDAITERLLAGQAFIP